MTAKLMEALDSRKEIILKLTVRLYIETAEPVGSASLSEAPGLDVSSATIRSELSELEELGYLTHPHTSAGRIPTELGYQTYVAKFMAKSKLEDAKFETLKEAISGIEDSAERMRNVAKALAEASLDAALVAFAPRHVYYTGISNLFAKPEFRLSAQVTTMSKVLDHLDEAMELVFPKVGAAPEVLIGRDNPFGGDCGLVIMRAPFGVVGLLGPMRMDYDKDWSLLAGAVEALKTI